MSMASWREAAPSELFGEPDDDGDLVEVEVAFAHGKEAQFTQSPPSWRGQPWEIDAWRHAHGPEWQLVASVTSKDAADAALRLLSIGEDVRASSYVSRVFRTGDRSVLVSAKDPNGGGVMSELYWHCASCGEHEPAQKEYEHGDWEKCECGGAARVMTLQEGAQLEQRIALGMPRAEADALFVTSLGRRTTHDSPGGTKR